MRTLGTGNSGNVAVGELMADGRLTLNRVIFPNLMTTF